MAASPVESRWLVLWLKGNTGSYLSSGKRMASSAVESRRPVLWWEGNGDFSGGKRMACSAGGG
jgi:hypothetical protein